MNVKKKLKMNIEAVNRINRRPVIYRSVNVDYQERDGIFETLKISDRSRKRSAEVK